MTQFAKRESQTGLVHDFNEIVRSTLNALLHQQAWDQRDRVLSVEDPALFTYNAATKDRIDIPAFDYVLDGKEYHKAAVSALDWDEAGETINAAAGAPLVWGAWYLTINAAGTITATPMDQAGNMAYASELAALASINLNSDNVSLPAGLLFGIITVQVKASQTFTADTTEFDSAVVVNVANFYFFEQAEVLAASDPAGTKVSGRVLTPMTSIAPDAVDATKFDTVGAVVAEIGGVEVTLAVAADQTFTLADTINAGAAASLLWGGWAVLQNAAGSYYTLSADGGEAASDMTYASKAAVRAALDALFIPPLYAKVAEIIVQCAASDTFTANTETLATTDAAVAYIDLTPQPAATAFETTDADAGVGNEDTVVPPAAVDPIAWV